MEKSLLDQQDIFINTSFASRSKFYDFVTQHLLSEKKIKASYKESILEREKEFPTGLNTGGINVAIPHTDFIHSNVTQLVITTLLTPIKFRQMDDPKKEVDVSIILLILFNKPQKQLALLQQIMKIVQNQQTLINITSQKDKESMITFFESIGG